MARHAKPKRRRARKLLCLLLAAVLLISSGGLAWHYRAAIRKRLFPEKNEPVLTELTAPDGVEAEMIRIASDGDVLKLDYVMPGLDTFSLYTVIRSLQNGKVLSATDCGTSDFSTGLVNGGFYVAESAEKQVRFYDHRGTLQRTQSLPSAAAAGMLSVTPDGRYICYGDAKEARIRLLDTVAGVDTAVCDFIGYLAFSDVRDGRFYLQDGQSTLRIIDAAAATCQQISVKPPLRLVNAYGCVSQTDSGYSLSTAAGQTEEDITVNSIDESAVYLSMERLLTVSSTPDGDRLTVYSRADNQYATYCFSEVIQSAVDLQNGYIAVVTGRNGEKPHAYLLNRKSLTLSQTGSQPSESRPTLPEEPVTPSELKQTKNLLEDIPVIAQNPEFPTGCESVSAVIAMRYAGSQLTVGEFVDQYLEKSSDFYTKDGVRYGPDPYTHFIGSPRSQNAFGCMAPVIENAMNRYYQGTKAVVNATGTELSDLCSRYIDRGIPCLVWVSIGMVEPYYTSSWTLPNGETYRWLANEHCMVLAGYDADHYYFSDPYRGALVKYSRQLSNERYTAFGKQALAITD